MPFLLSGADFRRRADAWKPHPKVSLTSDPAPLTAGVTSANRFGLSDAIDGGRRPPAFHPEPDPMMYSATFRDRRDGGPLVAARSMIWPNDENGGLIHD